MIRMDKDGSASARRPATIHPAVPPEYEPINITTVNMSDEGRAYSYLQPQ
jgi:hypothetical protein